MVRNYVKEKPAARYTSEDVAKAVQDVVERKKTYKQAEQEYGVRAAVIFTRIKGRRVPIDRMGAGRPLAIPADVENQIAECVIARADMGYPCDREELRELVREFVVINNIKTPFKDGKPGADWFISFLKRHPQISFKKAEHLQKNRKNARSPEIVYDFYNKLDKLVNETGLHDPSKKVFIFNADETGFCTDPSKLRALGEKGRALQRISGGSGRESISVLACVAADGSTLPPLIIFKGLSVQARWTSEDSYPGTQYGASKNGWMEEPVFYSWFTTAFIPNVKKLRQETNNLNQAALLVYDGHSSHISVRIVQAALDNKIHLMRLPSHFTDEPLDKCVFGPVKQKWDRILVNYGKSQMGFAGTRLSKSKFVELLKCVWLEGMLPENIISGFRTTGIWPVDANKFPKENFDPILFKKYEQRIALAEPEEMSTNTLNTEPGPSDNVSRNDSTPSSSSTTIIEVFTKALTDINNRTVSQPSATKKVIPRLQHMKYGEVLTTTEVLQRLEDAENKKKEKESTTMAKRKRKERGVGKKTSDTQKKRKLSSSSDSDVEVSKLVVDSSDDEEFVPEDISVLPIEYTTPTWSLLTPGTFLLIKFLGGPRKSTTYRYVCLIDSIDDDDGEITIKGLRCVDGNAKEFVVNEKDISSVTMDMIQAVLPNPELKCVDRKFIYVFNGNVDVFEK